MRIVLTGGGTGGHVFPLIAVAREIRRKAPGADIRFIGPVVFGAEMLPREGVAVRPIVAGKLPRYLTLRIIVELGKIPLGFLQAFWELYWYMPDVVFGKGGYGMVPVALVAWVFRIPVIIHESDAVAGLSTRIVSRFSRIVLTSFPKTTPFSLERVRVVGNPVRATIRQGQRERAQARFHLALQSTILVLGGSQGSDELNELMIQIAPQLVRQVEVIHQAGGENGERFAREMALALDPYRDANRFYHVVPFLDEEALADAYAVATVVIARAGAGAIFELALAGLPAIFVPLRGSAGNHQYHNAELLVRYNAAFMLHGTNVTPHLLLAEIEKLLVDEVKRRDMQERIRTFAKPNAASEIADIVLGFTKS